VKTVLLHELLSRLPPEWAEDLTSDLQFAARAAGATVVVLDDDPTGTQTVHGVAVLTEWTVDALGAELAAAPPAFYVLTNSRSLPSGEARRLNDTIGRNLRTVVLPPGRRFIVVSRSDSTLRGHFPAETDALAAALGGCDLTVLIPAFLDGGRFTVGDVHYVADGERLIPAGDTEFARDAAFGYRASNLREWVAEKTGGRIAAEAVVSISLEDLRLGGPERVRDKVCATPPGGVVIVNAASARDLQVATLGLLRAEAVGKRLLYRTAASFVPLRAGLTPRPPLSASELLLSRGGGLIVVGSYVPKTSAQLDALLRSGVACAEVLVEALLTGEARRAEIARTAQAAEAALRRGEDFVLYTSRQRLTATDAERSLAMGQRVSAALCDIVRAVQTRPRYVLAKGGITSSDIATQALGVRRALVLGQVRPGVPVWKLGAEARWPGVPYIVFPGNVGSPQTLVEIMAELRGAS
jgi:uncharacterized protein YgbK (DUF1537 family)